MSRPNNYEQRISEYEWDDLLMLWQAIESGVTPGWPPGKALEYLVLRAFQLGGAKIRWPYSVHEEAEEVEQIDGVVYWNGLACLIECKDAATAVNVEPLAKLRNQLLRRPSGAIGAVFSRQGFTLSAVTLARFIAPQTILLWSGEELAHTLTKRNICQVLTVKYCRCVEDADPNYDTRIEDTK